MKPIGVTQLNSQIKALLESHFISLSVEGEISNFTHHTSGHLYFSLKDENSSVKCVMFKGNTSRLKFRPQNGMKIIASCGLSVYTPRGEYKLMCESLEPAGIGSLKIAFEQLRQKLEAKGYFKVDIKKPLPKFPTNIALITSATGAALQDIRMVAENRWQLTRFTLFNTPVQGEGAKEQIVKNIQIADELGFDCIVLARGGGSIEDLWAFNEEVIADAIHHAKTPIVSAIGHEIDYLISDFTADMRAPTPSAAIEMLLPDKNEISMTIDELEQNMKIKIEQVLSKSSTTLSHLIEIVNSKSPQNQILLKLQESGILHQKLNQAFALTLQNLYHKLELESQNINFELKRITSKKSNELSGLEYKLNSLDPSKTSNESYPLLVKNGKKSSLDNLAIGDIVELQGMKTIAKALIQNINKL